MMPIQVKKGGEMDFFDLMIKRLKQISMFLKQNSILFHLVLATFVVYYTQMKTKGLFINLTL